MDTDGLEHHEDVPPTLVAALDRHKAALHASARPNKHGYIFLGDNRRSQPYRFEDAVKEIYAAMGQADLCPTQKPHDLRRTFGSKLIEAGAKLPNVQRKMRHSRASTTADFYIREFERQGREIQDTAAAYIASRPTEPAPVSADSE